MSKPLCWFLQLLGLVVIVSYATEGNWGMVLAGVVIALIGAIGIRERLKKKD